MAFMIFSTYNVALQQRHIRLDSWIRGELTFDDMRVILKEIHLKQLKVDGTVEITGGPFKGMNATVSRVDHEKEEATCRAA